MELSLVKIVDKNNPKSPPRYFGVNDKHYDAMLSSGGSNLDIEYEWYWLGDVNISEEILNEQGYYCKKNKDNEQQN